MHAMLGGTRAERVGHDLFHRDPPLHAGEGGERQLALERTC
jgi:hypothetical protein